MASARAWRQWNRLNIVAHDKFQEIIDKSQPRRLADPAKAGDSGTPSADDKKMSVQVSSGAMTRLGLAAAPVVAMAATDNESSATLAVTTSTPTFSTEAEKQAAQRGYGSD